MEKFCDISIEHFTASLAAKTSVPGGGAAAALTGALASSLCSMALNFTVGKKKFLEYDEFLKEILSKLEQKRVRLLNLIDEDGLGFEPLAKAYSLAKDDPKRDEVLQQATLTALKAPLEMVKEIAGVVDILLSVDGKCSKLLISDVICSYQLALAAMNCAAINVFVNTKSLSNCDKAKAIENEVDTILNKYELLVNEMIQKLTKELRG